MIVSMAVAGEEYSLTDAVELTILQASLYETSEKGVSLALFPLREERERSERVRESQSDNKIAFLAQKGSQI